LGGSVVRWTVHGEDLINSVLKRSLGFASERSPQLVSVIDPGTEYAKALVARVEGDRVVVIGEGIDRHAELPFERGGRAVDLRLRQACDRALRCAEDMTESIVGYKCVPDHVLITLPAHLVRQAAFTVRQKRQSPGQAISNREFGQVLSRAERLAVQQLAGLLGVSKAEVVLLAAEVMDIKVDGHSVSNPVGFYGSTLSVTLFNALARSQSMGIVERLSEHLELEILRAIPLEYALTDCLPMEEAILVDMGSALTSVVWARSGCPMRMTTVNRGSRDLTLRLAAAIGLSPEQAEVLKLKYALGELAAGTAQAVRQQLAEGVLEWAARVESALAAISAKSSLPPYMYLCGGGVELSDVLETVRRFPWLRHLSFACYPEVRLWGPGQIPGVFNQTGRAWGHEMTGSVALARWAVPRRIRHVSSTEVLGRIVRQTVQVYS